MEDLMLNSEECKVLIHHKDFLEKNYVVKICVPEFESSNDNDIIFAAVHGNVNNINKVKEFLNVELQNDVLILSEDNGSSLLQNEVPVITLSDSDTEVLDVSPCQPVNQTNKQCKKKRKKSVIDLTSSPGRNDDSVCEVSSTTMEPVRKHKCIPAEEFISITLDSQSSKSKNSLPVVKPISEVPRKLRPIVIDGNNIAREHGRRDNTYSCKGIKLSIEHFLQRGHTDVTAFVPHFRNHCKFGPVATTDQPLLEELARSGHVVFTPSRSYDDRFIVKLASMKGGVILSNDNYRDIIVENDSFRRTVEERLLMFCFVGDILMIPQDPLGRNGPSLEEFLSVPEDQK